MARSALRCITASLIGALVGLVLAALICWVWLSTVDGHSLEW